MEFDADDAGKDDEEAIASRSSVRVCVRVRPCIHANDVPVAVSADVGGRTVNLRKGEYRRDSKFSRVFDGTNSQEDVYRMFRSAVSRLLRGVNATVLAYGQTGSGKTHTMFGPREIFFEDDRTWGIAPRAADHLFREIKDKKSEGKIASATVHCSLVQIYNDQIYDMLSDRHMKRPLRVREISEHGGVYVGGLSKYHVSSTRDVMNLLERSESYRCVRSTEMNERSSRSHVLLRLHVETAEIDKERDDGTLNALRSHLTLVDLAGSEKWNTSVRMIDAQERELTHINKSLSTLSNVIRLIVQRQSTAASSDVTGGEATGHVPFRDSKLTRLLQDALGGNSFTTLIATVSPAMSSFEETLSTLRFAENAGKLVTKIKRNAVLDNVAMLGLARAEIKRLKHQLRQTIRANRIAKASSPSSSRRIIESDEAIAEQDLRSEVERLRTENEHLRRQTDRWRRQSERVRRDAEAQMQELAAECRRLRASAARRGRTHYDSKDTIESPRARQQKGLRPRSDRSAGDRNRQVVSESAASESRRRWDLDTERQLCVNANDDEGASRFLSKVKSVDAKEAKRLETQYSRFVALKSRRQQLEQLLGQLEGSLRQRSERRQNAGPESTVDDTDRMGEKRTNDLKINLVRTPPSSASPIALSREFETSASRGDDATNTGFRAEASTERANRASSEDDRVSFSAKDIGISLRVYSARLGCWYEGTVFAVHDPRKSVDKYLSLPPIRGGSGSHFLHCVKFESLAGFQWVNLRDRRYKCLKKTSDAASLEPELVRLQSQAPASVPRGRRKAGSRHDARKVKAAYKVYTARSPSRPCSKRSQKHLKEKERGWFGRSGGIEHRTAGKREKTK